MEQLHWDRCQWDGIGDTPYAIDANNVDRFPLMKPIADPWSEIQPEQEPFLTLLVAVTVVTAATVVAVAAMLYLKKRKR